MAQYIYRRPPYLEYDIEGIESWLEDLITDGLWLDKDGYVFGFMQFRPGTPKKLKYRLEAIEKGTFLGIGQPKAPDEKALTLYEEFGWEYLGIFFDFYIYRSLDEKAVELNTDPAIQAMSLNALKKRTGLWLLVMALTVAWGFYVLITKGRIISNLINEGWLPTLLLPGFLLLVVLWLMPKNSLDHFLPDPGADAAVPVAEFQGNAPIVTMAELAPEWKYASRNDGIVRQWADVLSPVNLFWAESAQLESSDGKKYTGSLEVSYHETADEQIAEALVKDYAAEIAQYASYTSVPLDAAQYGFDYLAVSENYAYAKIIIRDGCTVIKANCSIKTQQGNEHLYPIWLDLMTEKMA